MTKLSVCIPVEPGVAPPLYLVDKLLENPDADLEIVIAAFDATVAAAFAERRDARLVVLPPAPSNLSAASLWLGTIAAAQGDWITLVSPEDMLEPEMPAVLVHVEDTYPQADALAWNAFQIAPDATPSAKTSIALPMVHHVSEVDKTDMLQAFFQWEGSQRTPRMPFSLFHGAIKRSLKDTILAATGSISWLTPLPQYEWAARVLIFANGLALSNRPLSAVSTVPYRPRRIPSALQGFPFEAGLGLTAAIAEVQARVLHEFGSTWNGFNEHFVRACMFDCMLEHDSAVFPQKCQGYFDAIKRMPDGADLASQFQPQYLSQPPADARRGAYGKMLLVDRFISNARTAQEFYAVMSTLMTPIAIVTDHPELLIPSDTVNLEVAA